MRPAIALFISALVAIAYFPEGGEAEPGLDGFGNNYSPSGTTYVLDRKKEGEILIQKNQEADRLLAMIELEKEKVRFDVETLMAKPSLGLHGLPSSHFSKDLKSPSAAVSSHGAHGIAERGAVKHGGYRRSGNPSLTGMGQYGGNNQGPNKPTVASMLGHAPFTAQGLYAGVRYIIGYGSESESESGSDNLGMGMRNRGKESKKLHVKVARFYEDGRKVPKEARRAIKQHLAKDVKAGNYQPIPAH